MNPVQPGDKELVVLLHGILLNRYFMLSLARRLRRAGFDTLALTYPSRRLALDDIATFVHAQIAEQAAQHTRVHFVGHSMGGLVIRYYLAKYRPNNLGRVVMLGTPNHGSEWADTLRNVGAFKWLFGIAGQQLTTDSIHPTPTNVEIGIIAGNISHIPFASRILNAEHDGQVSVERTKLTDMRAHKVLACSHTLMPFQASVSKQVIHFLKNGNFF